LKGKGDISSISFAYQIKPTKEHANDKDDEKENCHGILSVSGVLTL